MNRRSFIGRALAFLGGLMGAGATALQASTSQSKYRVIALADADIAMNEVLSPVFRAGHSDCGVLVGTKEKLARLMGDSPKHIRLFSCPAVGHAKEAAKKGDVFEWEAWEQPLIRTFLRPPTRETQEAPSSFMYIFRRLPMPCGHRAWRPIHSVFIDGPNWRHSCTHVGCLECGGTSYFHNFQFDHGAESIFFEKPVVWKAEAQV